MRLTETQVLALVEKAGGYDQVLRVLSGELDLEILPGSRADEAPAPSIVAVPAALGFDERIERGGYGWRNGELTEERFPVTANQRGEREQKLFHFNRSLSSAEAARLIQEDGFEPAAIGEVLAFGEAFPNTQRRHPVVGLGSVAEIDGKASVPALWFDGYRRTLDLIWLEGDWHRNYRFLGVCRKPTC